MPGSQIGAIDAVILSHDQHADNLDISGRALLPNAGRVFTTVAGAAQTRGKFNLTTNANDAIETARVFTDALIVPLHNDGWAHFTESAEELEQAFDALGLGPRLRRLKPGAPTAFTL